MFMRVSIIWSMFTYSPYNYLPPAHTFDDTIPSFCIQRNVQNLKLFNNRQYNVFNSVT